MSNFSRIDRVNFELSNRCNMSHIHPRCPAHLEESKPPDNIPSSIVFEVLQILGEKSFDGCISFHQYGEPMMDPRLFWFLERSKLTAPTAKTLIWTNGSTLEENMVKDLLLVGLDNICVTAYTPKERARLKEIPSPPGFMTIYDPNWVEVFGIYEAPISSSTMPCYAPLTDIIVTRSGKISLCCRDWERRFIMGDLTKGSFLDIIESPLVKETYERLSRGYRFLDICKRCSTVRDWRGTHKYKITMRSNTR